MVEALGIEHLDRTVINVNTTKFLAHDCRYHVNRDS